MLESTRVSGALFVKNTFATNFLSADEARELIAIYGAPLYVYSKQKLLEQAKQALAVPGPYGLTARYAMKANSHPEVLRTLKNAGIKIDASSCYEARYAMEQGFAPADILLTSQQLAEDLVELVGEGVQYTACSLRQLETFGETFPNHKVSVRINPGMGSGHSRKVNTGGVTSSFGIWHEYIPQIKEIATRNNLLIERVHTHIGSGTDLSIWTETTDATLEIVEQFPDATIVNVGGGFKVGRMDNETSTDLLMVGELLRQKLLAFNGKTGRKLRLEIEPGTFMVANAGLIVAEIDDIIDTGKHGYKFIKLNTGMTELLRPSLYGAQHPIAILNDSEETEDYVVVGHCCESGDLLTPDAKDPEKIAERTLPRANIGDAVLIGGCGAYCASMAAHGYNSFPRAAEVLLGVKISDN